MGDYLDSDNEIWDLTDYTKKWVCSDCLDRFFDHDLLKAHWKSCEKRIKRKEQK
jgi:hypothetical protein